MTKEQAIERLKVLLLHAESTLLDDEAIAIETVLNLLKEKDKEIDLMAEQISNYDIDEGICKQAQVGESGDCEEFSENCKECIKQYFERKVEE